MEAFGLLMHGFAVLLTWKTLLLMMFGLVLGIFVGVLPGLGGPNGVAILLPLTFTMDPTSAIVMLSCIYWGALFGGAITSILFNIPGEAWSVATTFDGYPMAQQGKAAEALTAAFTSSFIGSLVAVLLITFLAPMISSFALKFGPPEFFSVYLLTFCSFVGLGREAKHKTVISMSLGLLLAGIGMDTVSGQLRMTFGSSELLRGVNFLVAVIGLFGISEILLTMEERLALRGHAAGISLRVVLSVWKDLPKYWVTLLRSSFIGCWLGITPGGAIAASFMGYNLAKRFSKDPDSFGKGRIEGVFAPETAAHASGTAALLPMLALGIPGSGTAAILLGGLMVWGLNPGPLLFVEHKDFVWGLIASMYLGNVVGLVLVLTTVPIFASILRVPFAAVAPMIVVSCAIGAYAIQNAMFDIWLMLGFGVVGYVFKKIGIPLAPFTLALVLGNRAEDAFRLSMIGSGGDMKVFWSNGLVGSITTLAIVLLFWPVIDKAFGSVVAHAAAGEGVENYSPLSSPPRKAVALTSALALSGQVLTVESQLRVSASPETMRHGSLRRRRFMNLHCRHFSQRSDEASSRTALQRGSTRWRRAGLRAVESPRAICRAVIAVHQLPARAVCCSSKGSVCGEPVVNGFCCRRGDHVGDADWRACRRFAVKSNAHSRTRSRLDPASIHVGGNIVYSWRHSSHDAKKST